MFLLWLYFIDCILIKSHCYLADIIVPEIKLERVLVKIENYALILILFKFDIIIWIKLEQYDSRLFSLSILTPGTCMKYIVPTMHMKKGKYDAYVLFYFYIITCSFLAHLSQRLKWLFWSQFVCCCCSHCHCRCKLFTFSSYSQDPLSQFQSNLIQILGWKEFKIAHMTGRYTLVNTLDSIH